MARCWDALYSSRREIEEAGAIVRSATMSSGSNALPSVAPVRSDDRWRVGDRARLPRYAVAIVAASLLLHGIVLAIALMTSPVSAVVQQEVPIEVIQAPPAEKAAPTDLRKAPAIESEKPPARQAIERPAPKAPPPAIPAPKPPSPEERQRSDLEKELAALKAEQASLDTEKKNFGGPLRESMHAVALPSLAGDGEDGDVVSYQSLVFSQLAKAKEGFAETGKAGVAGVRFSLDAHGGLADLAIAVPSGNPELDAEALAIVRRAAPFPPPPAGAERSFSANVAYASAR